VGPSLGGVVVDNFDWRAVFYMALPTCVLGLLMAPAFMIGRTRQGPRPSFDWTGFVLLSIFLITFLGGLSNGQRWGWHDSGVYLLLFIGLLSGVGFVWWESRTRRPMQDLRIFLNPGFGAASLVAMVLGAGIYGSTYLVPLFVQGIQGYSPTESGLVLMPAGVILALVFPLAGQITDRVRPHVPIILGLTLFSFSSYQLAKSDIHTSFALLATWIMVGRIGMGFILPALNAGAVRCLPMEQIAQGSGGVNFARQFGGALGVNLLSIMLDRRTFFHSDHFAQTQTAANEMTRELLRQVVSILDRSGVPAAWQQAGAVGYLGRVITQQARTAGFQDGFLIVAAVFMLAVIPAWVMGRYARR
jgi:EmrB/QacA subfamily drug resistance transporter